MANSRVIDIETVEEFEKVVFGSKLVVVDFYADWCKACVPYGKELEKVAENKKYSDVVFVKVKVDLKNNDGEDVFNEIIGHFEVGPIPRTIILKHNGNTSEAVWSFEGNNTGKLCELLDLFSKQSEK